jgi:uncharacterized SAM-binding protein YcdF (DUF218 family)
MTAIGAVWAIRRNSKRAEWLAVAGACGLAIGAFTPVGYWLAAPLEDRFPPWRSNQNDPPYGIIVLGGESGERTTVLAQLANRFPHARLAYSGPGNASDVRALYRNFSALGGDPKRLLIEARATTTFENAAYSREMIKPNPNERWLLVTAAMHMPRAVGCFRQAGFNVEAYPIQFTSRYRTYAQFLSKFGSQGLVLLDRTAREWAGLAVYRLMGHTDVLFPSP